MSARSITWNSVARAITWNSVVGIAAVTVAASGAVVVAEHQTPLHVVGVGANPWFADPSVSPDGKPTLPDLSSVEQVIGTQQAWANGATGKGVDVAVIDSGVTPVQGLGAPNKVVYGPDLSFDSQDPHTAFLDGFGHGTAVASIIAGNDGSSDGFQGVAPDARIVSVVHFPGVFDCAFVLPLCASLSVI